MTKLNPQKILERLEAVNYAKNLVFYEYFNLEFRNGLSDQPKTYSIRRLNHLRSFWNPTEVLGIHPFFRTVEIVHPISEKIHNFVITDLELGTYGLGLITKSKRAFTLMIQDHQKQSKAHPFFNMGGKRLRNPDFQILRSNRKMHNYGNFHTKQYPGNSYEEKYESWLFGG